jgi:hypothetical protein
MVLANQTACAQLAKPSTKPRQKPNTTFAARQQAPALGLNQTPIRMKMTINPVSQEAAIVPTCTSTFKLPPVIHAPSASDIRSFIQNDVGPVLHIQESNDFDLDDAAQMLNSMMEQTDIQSSAPSSPDRPLDLLASDLALSESSSNSSLDSEPAMDFETLKALMHGRKTLFSVDPTHPVTGSTPTNKDGEEPLENTTQDDLDSGTSTTSPVLATDVTPGTSTQEAPGVAADSQTAKSKRPPGFAARRGPAPHPALMQARGLSLMSLIAQDLRIINSASGKVDLVIFFDCLTRFHIELSELGGACDITLPAVPDLDQ